MKESDTKALVQPVGVGDGASSADCQVCGEAVPPGRLPLFCAGCGCSLHPSCATVVERGPGWGNRKLFCAACAGERTPMSPPGGAP